MEGLDWADASCMFGEYNNKDIAITSLKLYHSLTTCPCLLLPLLILLCCFGYFYIFYMFVQRSAPHSTPYIPSSAPHSRTPDRVSISFYSYRQFIITPLPIHIHSFFLTLYSILTPEQSYTRQLMEGSGENWPSDSDLEVGDDVNDFCFDDEEFPDDGETDRKRRRRELTERLLALSATIPGLKKKMDNTSILDKASNYVKQLQERVRELEQQVESHNSSNKGTTSCEVNSDDYYEPNDILPEVRARVSQKEVLVIIHCDKQKGIMLKILSQLENLHLSVVNSSVLPFGKSTLDITIIAQMGDGYNMTVDELVKSLRLAILTQ